MNTTIDDQITTPTPTILPGDYVGIVTPTGDVFAAGYVAVIDGMGAMLDAVCGIDGSALPDITCKVGMLVRL